jgi:hypothetical protein
MSLIEIKKLLHLYVLLGDPRADLLREIIAGEEKWLK